MSQATIYKVLKKDKVLWSLVESMELSPFNKDVKMDYFNTLIKSVVSQQLHDKAAMTIYARFLALFDTPPPTPESILALPVESLRSSGLSSSKVQYVRNIAEFALQNDLSESKLQSMTDDEIVSYLTAIKGVGSWTVHMLLIFRLYRPDVMPLGDLAIRKKIIQLYGLDKTKQKSKKALQDAIIEISNAWKPYRTTAVRLIWAHRDKIRPLPIGIMGPEAKKKL